MMKETLDKVQPGETVYFQNLPVNDMDEECVDLCLALNQLPGIQTIESCCGHCKNPYRIFFKCYSFESLAILTRVFDRRYSNTSILWTITAETSDSDPCNQFMLSTNRAYDDIHQMKEDIKNILSDIDWWSDPQYKVYFKSR